MNEKAKKGGEPKLVKDILPNVPIFLKLMEYRKQKQKQQTKQ